MSLDESLVEIFGRLKEWSRFPKYSLERRVDIFLTPFLAPFLSSLMEADVHLVAPEFPIKKKGSNQSVNLDYLLVRTGSEPAWIFLELKTDGASVRDEQLELYLRARVKGMRKLLAEIERGILPATKGSHNKHRYRHLLEAVTTAGELDAPIEIVYLSPKNPRGADVSWISLGKFSGWVPRDHGELWNLLSRLLGEMQNGSDSRAPKVQAVFEPGEPKIGDFLDGIGLGAGCGVVTKVERRAGKWTRVKVQYQNGCIPGPAYPGQPESEWECPSGEAWLSREELEPRLREAGTTS